MTVETVKKAIDDAGGAAVVASEFKINPVSVYEWIKKGRVPADRAPSIERLCNGTVLCEQICPDVDWAYLRTTTTEVEQATP